MKCQFPFSGKNKKILSLCNLLNLSRVVKIITQELLQTSSVSTSDYLYIVTQADIKVDLADIVLHHLKFDFFKNCAPRRHKRNDHSLTSKWTVTLMFLCM